MKRIYSLMIIVIAFAPGLAFSQVRKIPAAVTDAFKEKYPEAERVEWKDKISFFAAVFEMDNIKYEARFSSKGDWNQTEHLIDEDELPEAVKEGLEKSKYAEWKIEQVYKIDLPEDGVDYRIQVARSDIQKKNLLFNDEGRLLKDKITL